MVWNGNTNTSTGEFYPKAKGAEFNNSNNGYWNQKRGGVKGGFFPYPRRGAHARGAEFFAPRGFPPQQFRKMRPPWMPRGGLRPPPPPPPHFPPAPPESYMPYPAPPWPAPQPPQPQAPATSSASGEGETPMNETPHKKKKKTPNSTSKPWDKEAAEKAHALEMECQRSANAKSIVIRFPDPELSKEIVQNFHPLIDNVHFQGPCGVRYCFVTLKDEADVDSVMEQINKVSFGTGHLTAERKAQKQEENSGYENIDPFTLYVGNLALNISVVEVKEKFPTATRIDVGHAKRMKNTRYAFVKFSTAEAALEAYKASVNTIMASRSIIVRFRRHKATFGPPGEESTPPENEKPREKLTVGAKLKAKKEKAEKAAREEAERKMRQKLAKKEDDSEEEVDMDTDDDSNSADGDDIDDIDADDDDDDDDDDMMNMVRDSESEEDYGGSGEEDIDADDDDLDDDTIANLKADDDYFDEDDCKDVFQLTFDKL